MRAILLSITATFVFTLVFASTALAGGDAKKGEAVFNNKKLGQCSVCHKITAKKKVGPGLAGTKDRHTDSWMKKYLKDPQKVWTENDDETKEMKTRLKKTNKKKTAMKLKYKAKFTDEILEDLIAYLKTL
ncbi:MAG: c-type cytochrome [Nitrospinota bacterium]